MHRIHIVGLNPRTGTTLLAECMRLSFRIECSEAHEADLNRTRRCQGVYLTKNPRDIEHVALRLTLDPRFNVICLARDPRDVVVSKHGTRPDDYWPKSSLARYRERWQAAKALRGHPRFLLVRFEDLIADPDAVQRTIADRFPFLETTGAFSDFHTSGTVSGPSAKAMNGVRAIDPTNHSNWTQHLPRLAEQLRQHGSISRELIELGYEADDVWLAEYGLPDAPAQDSPRKPQRRQVETVRTALLMGVYARLGIPVG